MDESTEEFRRLSAVEKDRKKRGMVPEKSLKVVRDGPVSEDGAVHAAGPFAG